MTKEIQKKMAEALKEKGLVNVEDVCATEKFQKNLEAYIKVQREERAAARSSEAAIRSLGAGRGLKLRSHVIDKTLDWSLDRWCGEYLAVVYGQSPQPAKVREYVFQLGRQAYLLTVAQFVVEKYPELEDTLIPKKS